MKVYVNDSDGTNINLRIPTGLLLNRITTTILFKILNTVPGVPDLPLTKEQAFLLLKALKDYKKSHPGWKLVEVHSADGDVVEITV